MKEKAPAPAKTQGAEGTQSEAQPFGELCQPQRQQAIDRLPRLVPKATRGLRGVILRIMLALAAIVGGLGR